MDIDEGYVELVRSLEGVDEDSVGQCERVLQAPLPERMASLRARQRARCNHAAEAMPVVSVRPRKLRPGRMAARMRRANSVNSISLSVVTTSSDKPSDRASTPCSTSTSTTVEIVVSDGDDNDEVREVCIEEQPPQPAEVTESKPHLTPGASGLMPVTEKQPGMLFPDEGVHRISFLQMQMERAQREMQESTNDGAFYSMYMSTSVLMQSGYTACIGDYAKKEYQHDVFPMDCQYTPQWLRNHKGFPKYPQAKQNFFMSLRTVLLMTVAINVADQIQVLETLESTRHKGQEIVNATAEFGERTLAQLRAMFNGMCLVLGGCYVVIQFAPPEHVKADDVCLYCKETLVPSKRGETPHMKNAGKAVIDDATACTLTYVVVMRCEQLTQNELRPVLHRDTVCKSCADGMRAFDRVQHCVEYGMAYVLKRIRDQSTSDSESEEVAWSDANEGARTGHAREMKAITRVLKYHDVVTHLGHTLRDHITTLRLQYISFIVRVVPQNALHSLRAAIGDVFYVNTDSIDPPSVPMTSLEEIDLHLPLLRSSSRNAPLDCDKTMRTYVYQLTEYFPKKFMGSTGHLKCIKKRKKVFETLCFHMATTAQHSARVVRAAGSKWARESEVVRLDQDAPLPQDALRKAKKHRKHRKRKKRKRDGGNEEQQPAAASAKRRRFDEGAVVAL